MFLKLTLPWGYKIAATFSRVQKVVGVNSDVGGPGHILMWDFDDCPIDNVLASLRETMLDKKLGPVWLFRTAEDSDHFHAFCLNVYTFPQALSIVAGTEGVCWDYVKWSALRGRFTLRVGPKEGAIPHQIAYLKSPTEPDLQWPDMRSFVEYETLRKGVEHYGEKPERVRGRIGRMVRPVGHRLRLHL